MGPVSYDFIVPVHKSVTLNWYSTPLQDNLHMNVKADRLASLKSIDNYLKLCPTKF